MVILDLTCVKVCCNTHTETDQEREDLSPHASLLLVVGLPVVGLPVAGYAGNRL